MQNAVSMINEMPEIGSTIQVYGKSKKVSGYKITADAAYVMYDDGNFEFFIHQKSLTRCSEKFKREEKM